MDSKRKREPGPDSTGNNKKTSKFSDGGTGGAAGSVAGLAVKSQAELLQQQIAMQLAAVSSQLEQAKQRVTGGDETMDRKPASMMLDADGNIVDGEGNKMKTEKTAATLKANINEPRKKFVNPYLAHKTVEVKDKNTQLDVNVRTTKHEGRKKKSLQFVRQGTYVKQADNLRYTPYPTPTLHPTPYTLHPTPYTLHRRPYMLDPRL
jgi:hypothetical protein